MNPQSPEKRADVLISALERYGQGDYIGESISQLEHCLQAAHQARKAGKFLS
jgi:predicted HD phosphohydrolase